MKKIKAHMICHTHWDREWYLTREQFMPKLVRLVDSVLAMSELYPNGVSFMLDGQLIAIEDYLQIKPQNKQRIINAIQAGRIFVGPWYILPDEMLVSGESHIRNYLIGDSIAAQLGGKMNIGYLPDSFGHPEQMPQILKGLSMDTILFWRGTGNHMVSSEFIWQSPCVKCSVLGVHLPFGYGNSARLSCDVNESLPRVSLMMDNLGARSATNIVLMMNGSDHILNQADIADVVEDLNALLDDDKEIVLSTMESYVSELKCNLPKQIETHKGELRYGDRSMLLGGTISTRMYLKQWNIRVERAMERYLEPMAASNCLAGLRTDFCSYQGYIWKKILENHPHDSICGCSIDPVHAEMMTRFHCVDQMERTLISDTIHAIGDRFITDKPCGKAQLLHFEPTQDGLPTYKEVDIDFDVMLVKRVNFALSNIDEYEDDIAHPDFPTAVQVIDRSGRAIQAVILSVKKDYYMHLQDQTAPEVYKVNRCTVGLLLPSFEYGYSVLTAERCDRTACTAVTADIIENEFYSVCFDNETAALVVTDKTTGRVHHGVNRLLDLGDAGDEYTYSWPQTDMEYTLNGADCKVTTQHAGDILQRLTVRGTLFLPDRLADNRKSRSDVLTQNPITIVVTLYAHINRIDFEVEFYNQSSDHILKVEFPAGVLTQKSVASTAFAVTPHDVAARVSESWVEYPFANQLTHGFIDLNDGEYGLSLACDGITEYEAVNRNDTSSLQLTLLRCVGWLSRADLLTRCGNGGWSLETPEAQCKGKQQFRYSVIYHQGDWRQSGTYAMADRALHNAHIEQRVIEEKEIDMNVEAAGFVSQLPPLVRLSALKPAEDGDGLILRVFCIADETQTVQLTMPELVSEVLRCGLNEAALEGGYLNGHNLQFEIIKGEILTFRLRLKCRHVLQ